MRRNNTVTIKGHQLSTEMNDAYEMNDAFNAGYLAFAEGKDMQENPYDDAVSRGLWEDGWDEARREEWDDIYGNEEDYNAMRRRFDEGD
jgi:ribosome modulation factor